MTTAPSVTVSSPVMTRGAVSTSGMASSSSLGQPEREMRDGSVDDGWMRHAMARPRSGRQDRANRDPVRLPGGDRDRGRMAVCQELSGRPSTATTAAMLRARGSFKWTAPGPDGFGAAVAEMDFGAAPPILDALARLSADANFGYLPPFLADELAAACADFEQRRYGWDVDPALDPSRPRRDQGGWRSPSRTSPARAHRSSCPRPAYMPFLVRAGLPRPRDHPGQDAR